MFDRFIGNTAGATAIEYGLIAALLATIVLTALTFLNDPVNGLFGGIVELFQEINQDD